MLSIEMDTANQTMKLVGKITLSNACAVLEQGKVLLSKHHSVCIDASGLKNLSTVALALFLAWEKFAIQLGYAIKFSGLSEKMVELASVSGLSTVLAIQE